MNPARFSQMMKYLTRAKKANPDLPDVFPASKAPIPPVREDVETMDAINAFIRRERQQKAGGGMLVQPGFGGVRQGYGGTKPKSVKDSPEFKKITQGKNKGKYSVRITTDGKRKTYTGTITELQKIFDEKAFNTKLTRQQFAAQQAGTQRKIKERFDRIGKAFIEKDYKKLKIKTRPARMEKGAIDAGGILNNQDTKLLNDVILGKDVKAQNALAKKLGVNRRYMIDTYKEVLEFTKTGKSTKQSELALKKIVTQKKLFDEILENPDATVKSMAKKFNKTEKEIVEQSSKLLTNVYAQNVAISKENLSKEPLKSWLPDDFNTTDNFLDNFSNIKGLRQVQSENIGTLIMDAFGKGKNPKKYVAALQGLSEYNKFLNTLPGDLKLDLDHPLSKAFLKGSNVSPEKLLYVTPISRGYNRGFKQSLSMAYDKALLADVKDIKKIKQIENLAKTLNINIGKGSTKKFDFGTTNIAEKTQEGLREELAKNLREQNLASKNLQKLKKTDEGKKLLKEIFPRGQKLEISQVDKKLIATLSKDPRCSRGLNSQGGRAGFQEGTPPSLDVCYQGGVRNINSGMKNATAAQAKNFAAFANRAASLGRGIMKYGIVPEALYVAADSLVRVGMGDSLNESLLRASEYLLPGNQTKKAEMLEADRFFGPEVAGIIGKSIDYKNELAKVQSLQDQKANLENLSGGGAFDYVGDTSQDVKNIDVQLKQATDNLNNKFKMTDAERIYAERMQDEVDDARSSGSLFTKLKSKFRDVGQDQSDVETLGMPEQTQQQLNQKLLPTLLDAKDIMQYTTQDAINLAQAYRASGEKVSAKDILTYRDSLKNAPLSELAQQFNPESVYGASGTMGEPINKPPMEKPQNVIGDMEKEIVGQTNVANPFDLDISDIGSGLRGFAAAGGGIAKSAGVASGPPPVSGPNSQGLQGLLKRVRNY